jgi:hypothetical protein
MPQFQHPIIASNGDVLSVDLAFIAILAKFAGAAMIDHAPDALDIEPDVPNVEHDSVFKLRVPFCRCCG